MTQHTLDLHILNDIALDRGVDVLVEDLLNDADSDVQVLGEKLRQCQGVLDADLTQLPAQIIATCASDTTPAIKALVKQARAFEGHSWLRPRHQCMFNSVDPLVWADDGAHDAFIGSIVALPDNERFVTASEDGSMKVWSLSQECLKTLDDHSSAINSIKLSPDGTRLLAASDDETLSLRSITSWARDVTMTGHSYYISEADITTTGRVVSTSKDASVKVFDASSGECLHTLEGHNAWVYSLAVSPDGKRAVTGSLNNKINVWDIEKGELVKCLLGEDAGDVLTVMGDLYIGRTNDSGIGHADSPSEMRWTQDGQHLVSVANDIIVWDTREDAYVEVLRMNGHAWKIQDMALFDNDTKLVTVAHCVKIWDMATGEEITSFIGHDGTEIYSVAVTPDQQKLITGDNNGILKVWDLDAILGDDSPAGQMGRVYDPIVVSDDGETILTTSSDQTAILWDSHTGQPRHHLRGHSNLFVYGRGFVDNDKRCITVSDGEIRTWDVQTGEQINVLTHSDNSLYGFGGMCLYDNGTKAVCGAVCYPLTRWDLNTGEFINFAGKTAFCDDFALTSDEKFVLTDSYFDKDDDDDDDMSRGTNEMQEWADDDDAGDVVAAMPVEVHEPLGFDYTCPVQLWDIEHGRLFQQFYPPTATGDSSDTEYPVSVSWDESETRVIGAFSDGRLHVWDRSSADVLWSVQAHDDFVYNMVRYDEVIITLAKDDDGELMHIRGFDLNSGEQLWQIDPPNHSMNYSIFSDDARLLAGAIDDHTVVVIDMATRHVIGTFTNPRELSHITIHGQMLVLGDVSGFITCMDIITP